MRVPTAAEALLTPVFSIIGAVDDKVYGLTANNPRKTTDGSTMTPTDPVVGYFTETSFTPVGAMPEAVPPASSQYTAGLSGQRGREGVIDWVESSIWSMTADAVPVLYPNWVNPADAAVQSPPYFVYEAVDQFMLVSANPDVDSALRTPRVLIRWQP